MIKQTYIEFGKKLRTLRLHSQSKQSEIAKQLGVSQQAYSNLENGKTQFTDVLIEKICDIFNVDFQEFLLVNSQQQKSKMITKINDIDMYTARIMIANLKKQLIEKELKIVQLELQIKKPKIQQVSNADKKPIYVLI